MHATDYLFEVILVSRSIDLLKNRYPISINKCENFMFQVAV